MTRAVRIDRRAMVAGSIAAGIAPSALHAQGASPVASPVSGGDLPLTEIGILTGSDPAAFNQTGEKWEVYGTDLGSSFLFGDEIAIVFGDTFAQDGHDWRSNVLAFSSDEDPENGITFDRMIEDAPGHAKELLPAKRLDNDEITIIPTYGIGVGKRMILHYMSVKHWGAPGNWTLGSAGFATSDDGGESWEKDPLAVLPGDTNWGQVAMVEEAGSIYLFGIPGGRYGGVKLARVSSEHLLNIAEWTYWDGSDFVPDQAAAIQIIPPYVGELSVRWNSYYQRWIMMYLVDNMGQIVLRTAENLTGPWSDERVVVRSIDYPALYAPFMYPRWNDGPDIYFNMSLFGPYNVYLMKTSIPDLAP